MKSTKTLFEDLGSLTRRDYINNPTRNPTMPPDPHATNKNQINNIIRASGNDLGGVKLFDFSFRPWQSTLIHTLSQTIHPDGSRRHRVNVYQVASPGAGKTAPIVYHWAELLGLNPSQEMNVTFMRRGVRYDPNAQSIKLFNDLIMNMLRFLDRPKGSLANIPKILYLCPVRHLVYEIQKDFTEHVSKILYHLFHIAITVRNNPRLKGHGINSEGVFHALANNGINITRQIQERTRLFNEMGHFQTQGNYSGINDQQAQKLAKDIAVIDEQIMTIITSRLRDYIKRNIISIKTGNDPVANIDAPVMLTIYESGKNIFKKMDKKQIALIVIDEAHLAQRMNEDEGRDEKIPSLYYILRKLNSLPNGQLILLSGTVNPQAASNLINFLHVTMNIDITQLETGNAARNPSNISVMPMDSLSNDNTLLKLMLSPSENNNVIILFSKARIDGLVKKALLRNKGHQYTADQIQRGELQKRKSQSYNINLRNLEKDSPQNTNKRHELNQKQFMAAMTKMPEVSEISDPILLQAVLSGFGYIYSKSGKNQRENKNITRDAQIVAHLFSKGKIKTLLATDAIGIGINLTIQNMYVPKIEKFNGKEMQQLPISDASQLYNRTGRMSFTTSSIYTPKEYVGEIIKAISATNNSFDMRETLTRFGKNLSDRELLMTFHSVWRSFVNLAPIIS